MTVAIPCVWIWYLSRLIQPATQVKKNIVVSNGKTSGEIFPLLGALIGGSIKNGVMRIYKIRDGMIDKANYTGQIKMPISVGTTGTGQLEGAWTANGGGVCIWRASLRKL